MTSPLWQKAKRNYRASLWKWNRRVKSWLKIQHLKNLDHVIQSHHFMANRWGNNGNGNRLYFLGLWNHCRYEIKRWLLLGRKAMTNLDSILKIRNITLPTSSHSYGLSSSHVWMWQLEHIVGWASKNWCFWTVVLDKTLESPLNCKEIQPVYPKWNQSWIFIIRTDAEAEMSIHWP